MRWLWMLLMARRTNPNILGLLLVGGAAAGAAYWYFVVRKKKDAIGPISEDKVPISLPEPPIAPTVHEPAAADLAPPPLVCEGPAPTPRIGYKYVCKGGRWKEIFTYPTCAEAKPVDPASGGKWVCRNGMWKFKRMAPTVPDSLPEPPVAPTVHEPTPPPKPGIGCPSAKPVDPPSGGKYICRDGAWKFLRIAPTGKHIATFPKMKIPSLRITL